MDRNYTGGFFQLENIAKRAHRHEHCEIVAADDVIMSRLVKTFDKMLLSRDMLTRQTIEETGATSMNEYDKVFVCKMCKNYFTINRSYGKHECFAHYGYKDHSRPGAPVWSCCGNALSSIGCMECDHLPNVTQGSYSNAFPTMEVSLTAGLYGATLPAGNTFFLKRYLKDEKLRAIMKRDERFFRIKLVFLDEEMFRVVSKSGSMASKIKSRYIPFDIKKPTKRNTGKRERVYINMNRSKFIVPLSRPQ